VHLLLESAREQIGVLNDFIQYFRNESEKLLSFSNLQVHGIMPRKRWYDQPQYKALNASLEFLKKLPEGVIEILGSGFCQIIHTEIKVSPCEAKQLGSEKTLALYKQKNKTRDYDQSPKLHEAMSQLTLMEEPQRLVITKSISKLCDGTLQYFTLCSQFQQLPDNDDIKHLVHQTLERGDEGLSKVLLDYERLFEHKRASSSSQKPVKITDSGEGQTLKS
jgi:hypothetical protein